MAKIGIDFGTSYSTVAYINPQSGNAEAIRINGSEKIPTMLYYSPDGGEPMIGQEAFEIYSICNDIDDKEEVEEHLARIFSSELKRNMNKEEVLLYLPDGRELHYVDMIGEFFAFIKKEVETTVFNGEKVTDVCITHPVDFPTYKKEILVEAARKAGFPKIKLLMEPVAASMGFSNTANNFNESVLIYDFGGGTFDLAFVKFDAKGDHITLPPMGDANCGGENIDKLLYDTWDKLVMQQTGKHISALEGSVDLPFLKTVCVKQKEFLANYFKKMSKWDYKTSINGHSYVMPVTKDFFNNLISPIIDKTILLTKNMLEAVKHENFKVDKVILIGGSSQIPLVTEMLKPILPVPPQKVADSDIAVAKGAAIFANEDEVPVHKCFCRECGKVINTKLKDCPYCGKDNYKYNHKYDNEDIVSRTVSESSQPYPSVQQFLQFQQPKAPQKCFCNGCGNQINKSMKFCNKCGAKNSRYSNL